MLDQACVSFDIIGTSPLPYMLSGVLSIVGLCGIAFKLWYLENTARLGSKSINLILPIYTIPVAYVVVVGITVGFTNIMGMYSTSIAIAAAKWLLFRVAADGLAIFLLHNGIGLRALQRSLLLGTLWAVFSASVPLLLYFSLSIEAYSKTAIAFLSLLVAAYAALYLAPTTWIHRRPAMSRLALWNTIICLAFLITHLLLLRGVSTGSCLIECLASACWLVQPFIILQALRQDSLFWQGLYVPRATGAWGGGTAATLNQPLLGIWDIGRTTMDLVLDSLASLEKRVVPIIPFGFLELDNSRFFSGGTARVYRGTYGPRAVAIKMLFCLELTPERVVSFCAEATLLNSLQVRGRGGSGDRGRECFIFTHLKWVTRINQNLTSRPPPTPPSILTWLSASECPSCPPPSASSQSSASSALCTTSCTPPPTSSRKTGTAAPRASQLSHVICGPAQAAKAAAARCMACLSPAPTTLSPSPSPRCNFWSRRRVRR